MLKLILLRCVLLLGLIALFFSALLSWQSDQLSVEIKKTALIDNVGNTNYLPLISRPLRELLYKASHQTNVDSGEVIELFDAYRQRRPFDAAMWVLASQAYQRLGDVEMSSQALNVAHRLGKTNIAILQKVFNRYLELGLNNEALDIANDIVSVKPREFRRLFYLMSRLSDNYQLLVEKMIPLKVPLLHSFKKPLMDDAYFDWALSDAIRIQNTALAQAVWNGMPGRFKRNTDLGLRYIDYIIEFQDPELVNEVWFDVVGEKMELGKLLNSGQSLSSPCWHKLKVGATEAVIGDLTSAFLLELKFLGGRNIDYRHMTCIVRVQPESRYVLSGSSKGSDITTLSGPFIEVLYPNVNSPSLRSKALIGSWPWSEFELIMDVPAGVHFAKIRIRRKKTKLLDSEISGLVWFKGIEIAHLNGSQQEVINLELFE